MLKRLLAVTLAAWIALPSARVATITLTPGTTYQTIVGWEATAQAGQIDDATHAIDTDYATYGPNLINSAVTDFGLNRLRVEIHSGWSENTADYYQQWLDGSITTTARNNQRYVPVNDNADPDVRDDTKFFFTNLDIQIQYLADDFRDAVLARNEVPYIVLCYVDFGTSAFEHTSDVDEYAELIEATFDHMQDTYGWVPDAVEVILEPDNTPNWTGTVIGNAIVATKARLDAAGYTGVDFIGPSTTSFSNAGLYFDDMIAVTGVSTALTDISYHLYSGNDDTNRTNIAADAAAYGMRTAMLEFLNAGYLNLHADLKVAKVSSWQQFALAFPTSDNGNQYYTVSGTTITLADSSRYLRQYFRYIRPDAVRIAASSSNGALDPLAFINTGSKYVVVVKATSSQSFTIGDLPAGTYGIRYTTAAVTDVDPGNQTIAGGGEISTSIPAAGVLTVYRINDTIRLRLRCCDVQ